MPGDQEQAQRERSRADLLAKIVAAGVLVFAVLRVATAKAIDPQPVATEAQERAAFSNMAGNERRMRRDAAHDFPADPWSQDDAFHNFEFKEARGYGEGHSMRLQDVLAAIDRGMHEHWSTRGNYMIPTVPPCRPRPIH